MGFFKKFLSLGSRRSKKRRAGTSYETRPNPPLSAEDARRQQQEQEEIANMLLRSSSLRYAVVNEVDYSSLPPLRKYYLTGTWPCTFLTYCELVYLAHPVNSLSQRPSAPPSRSASVQTRRTYTVTIRDRKVEALTEFPNANPPLDPPTPTSRPLEDQSGQAPTLQPFTPKDQNRLRALRRDPSVASLLDMYDSNGRLDISVFSNTPPATEKESSEGRAQLKRGGSTLRQLLGNPESTNPDGSTEGDISWAEGFLQYGCSASRNWLSIDCVLCCVYRERALDADQSSSPASSFRLETPKDSEHGDTVICESDPATASSDGSPYPHRVDLNTHTAMSPMTVALSYSSDDNPALAAKHTTESELRPAAEVFGFLLEKRRSRRSTSMPLTVPSSPWDLNSSASPGDDVPATPLNTKQSSSNRNDLRSVGASASVDTPSTIGSILDDPPNTAAILNHTRIPVAHGRLCEGPPIGQLTATAVTTRASRIPRGRHSLQLDTRALVSETCSSSTEPVKPNLAPTCRSDALRSATNAVRRPSTATAPPVSLRLNALFAPVPMQSARRRSVSHGSNRPISADTNMGPDATRVAGVKGLKADNGNKENIISDVENAGIRVFSSFASI